MLRDFLHLWLVGISFTCVMFTGSLGKRTKLTKFYLDGNYQLDLRMVATTGTAPSNDVIWIHNWLDTCMMARLYMAMNYFPSYEKDTFSKILTLRTVWICLSPGGLGWKGWSRVPIKAQGLPAEGGHTTPVERIRFLRSWKDASINTKNRATYELTIHPFIPSISYRLSLTGFGFHGFLDLDLLCEYAHKSGLHSGLRPWWTLSRRGMAHDIRKVHAVFGHEGPHFLDILTLFFSFRSSACWVQAWSSWPSWVWRCCTITSVAMSWVNFSPEGMGFMGPWAKLQNSPPRFGGRFFLCWIWLKTHGIKTFFFFVYFFKVEQLSLYVYTGHTYIRTYVRR